MPEHSDDAQPTIRFSERVSVKNRSLEKMSTIAALRRSTIKHVSLKTVTSPDPNQENNNSQEEEEAEKMSRQSRTGSSENKIESLSGMYLKKIAASRSFVPSSFSLMGENSSVTFDKKHLRIKRRKERKDTQEEGKSVTISKSFISTSSSYTDRPSSTESNKSEQVDPPNLEEEFINENEEEEHKEDEISADRVSSMLSVEEEEIEEEEIPFVSIFEKLDAPREVLSQPDIITPEMLKDISVDLGQIRLCWPKKEKIKIDFMPNVILPDGYLMNTNKEKVLLLYTENFRVQYHTRFPNRKPLLLCGDNVAGQRKMVCTTLRPTTLPHPNLSTWQELASFLADHIKYEPLEPPTKLKSRLLSPFVVFRKKNGHTFEMSTALCSLLLGRNYNAFCVYGFATRDATECIMIRTECPFDEKEVEEVKQESVQENPKYILKPPRDLRSKFLMEMEQKDVEKQAQEKEKQEEIRRRKIMEKEAAPHDDLHCRRLHGWVCIMPAREDKETAPFFIEPTSGMAHPIDSPLYCTIQSIWNNTNYWVNLQDDNLGIGNMSFDLTDVTKWEHLLPGEPIHDRIHNRELEMEDDEDQAALNLLLDEQHLDMPEPWSLRINVSHQDVTNRFPLGNKKTVYKRTIVEQFSPYSQEDGLVMKIFKYSDMDCTDLITIEERYKNRSDKWSKRTENVSTGLITEFYDRGRDDNVKLHTFFKANNEVESWRQIEFYYKSRFDCLKKINHDWYFLEEDYVGREDLFYFRRTEYAKRGEPPPGFIEGPRRIIKSMVEKFERNTAKFASDDIAIREFDYVGRKISLQFHYDVGKITASTRVFLKPPLSEMVEGVSFKPELTYGYQAEIGAKPPKHSTLYALLERQLKDEEEGMIKVRHVEDAIAEFIRIRALEVLQPKLDVGLFNREQNKENRRAMLDKESEDRTKKEREIEDELDYIRPYLVRDGLDKALTYQQALTVRNDCLRELQDMMLKRANRLQQQFQAQLAYLKKRREWYNDEVDNLTFEEEQEYFRELNQANFVLHCMDLRLIRWKEVVPQRVEALLKFLEMHPKLQVLKRRKHRNISRFQSLNEMTPKKGANVKV